MNISILSRVPQEIMVFQKILESKQCNCIISTDLCMLERDAKNRVLHFLLADQDYLLDNTNISILLDCLGILNDTIPIVYFDKKTFTTSIISNVKVRDVCTVNDISKLLKNVQYIYQNIEKNKNNLLRPIEKKLYTFLKTKKGTSASLTEMSNYLWGTSNNSHTKTLYTYIYRIKQILQNTEHQVEWIVKEKKGCYAIFSETQKHTPTLQQPKQKRILLAQYRNNSF